MTVFPDVEQYSLNHILLMWTCHHHLCPESLLVEQSQFSSFSPMLSPCLFLHYPLSWLILVFLVWLSVIIFHWTQLASDNVFTWILTKSSFLRTSSFTSSPLIVVRFPCLNKQMYITMHTFHFKIRSRKLILGKSFQILCNQFDFLPNNFIYRCYHMLVKTNVSSSFLFFTHFTHSIV